MAVAWNPELGNMPHVLQATQALRTADAKNTEFFWDHPEGQLLAYYKGAALQTSQPCALTFRCHLAAPGCGPIPNLRCYNLPADQLPPPHLTLSPVVKPALQPALPAAASEGEDALRSFLMDAPQDDLLLGLVAALAARLDTEMFVFECAPVLSLANGEAIIRLLEVKANPESKRLIPVAARLAPPVWQIGCTSRRVHVPCN